MEPHVRVRREGGEEDYGAGMEREKKNHAESLSLSPFLSLSLTSCSPVSLSLLLGQS